MDLGDIYTEVIGEHSTSKRNKRKLEKPDLSLEGINPSCGDEISIEVKLDDNSIEDIAYNGVGCAISQASASIMSDLVRGRTIDDTKRLIDLFLGMIKGEIKDDDKLEELEEAIVFKNISNMPARVKCAVLAWHTLDEVLKKNW